MLRAAVSGGAGTGKTVLAMEEARRCAESSLRTLFVCYNRGLATETRRRLKDGPPGQRVENVVELAPLDFRGCGVVWRLTRN